MDKRSPTSVYEMDVDDLRKRVEFACNALADVHQMLQPLLDAADAANAPRRQPADLPPAGDSEGMALDNVLTTFNELLSTIAIILPGLESPPRSMRGQLLPDPGQLAELDRFIMSYTPPSRPPDTAPTLLEHQVAHARELFERSRLLGRLQELLTPIMNDLESIRERLHQRAHGISTRAAGRPARN